MSERRELLRQAVLRVIPQCPQCQQPFEATDVHFFGRMEESWMFSLYCRACRTLAIVGLAVTSTAELSQAQEQEQPQEQAPAGAVTADDVLDMHLFLKGLRNFDGLGKERT